MDHRTAVLLSIIFYIGITLVSPETYDDQEFEDDELAKANALESKPVKYVQTYIFEIFQ